MIQSQLYSRARDSYRTIKAIARIRDHAKEQDGLIRNSAP